MPLAIRDSRPDWNYTDHIGGVTVDNVIGVRDAKARLSEILRDVQRGGQWTITDHGRPVARLAPPEMARLPLEQRLKNLEERDWIQPRDDTPRPLPPPLPLAQGLASQWLKEGRDGGL